MTRNKFPTIIALSLTIFLFFPLWTQADKEGTLKMDTNLALQAADDIQMRNNDPFETTFSIKLFGGLGHLIGENEVNNDLDGWNLLLTDVSSFYGYGLSGEIQTLGYGPFFGGEMVFTIIPHFSVGLGAGYLWFTKNTSATLDVDGIPTLITLEPKISTIPLTLSLYYGLPMGKFLKINVGAGAGFYMSQFSNSNIQASGDEEVKLLFDSRKNSFGFHGSLDFELNITRSIAFMLGVSGRFASLKDLTGTETLSYTSPAYTESDTSNDLILWYIEEEIFDGKYYASLYPDRVKPEGEWFRVVRRAEISLNSISIQAGIVFRFGRQY